MFVAMTRFRVRAGQETMVRNAFGRRPMKVDEFPGFVRMEVFSAQEQGDELRLIAVRQDRGSFEHWRRHQLNESHGEVPRGLKVEKGSRALQYFGLVGE